METFFWHDYETFGRDPRRDRPAQFAGVRTDAELRELEAPLVLFCQPSPDALPDPWSCVLTGITPQQCLREGVPERVFAERIHAELARPGTIGAGYNSMRFDDEFTRHLFWRSLLDPYGREWRDGCGRWDLLDVMRAAWALRPEGIEWPQRDDGQVSLRLEHLSAANGLAHEHAHDALSDVRATIALARLLRARQPRLYAFALGLRQREQVLAQMGLLQGAPRPFVHVSGRLGAQRGFLAVMWPLAVHPRHRHEIIAWDLSYDPLELADLRPQQVRDRLFRSNEALAEEGLSRLPLKTVHVNRAPIVIGNLAVARRGPAERFGLDWAAIERHQQHAARLPDLSALWQTVFAPAERSEPLDVDAALYDGFVSDEDRRRLQRLRQLDPAEPAWRQMGFDDARLPELVFRFRARNHPETLTEEERSRWRAHCRARWLHGLGGARTLAEVLRELQQLDVQVGGDARQQALAQDVRAYVEAMAAAL